MSDAFVICLALDAIIACTVHVSCVMLVYSYDFIGLTCFISFYSIIFFNSKIHIHLLEYNYQSIFFNIS